MTVEENNAIQQIMLLQEAGDSYGAFAVALNKLFHYGIENNEPYVRDIAVAALGYSEAAQAIARTLYPHPTEAKTS